VRGVDNRITFMCQLSWNMEASTSWNLQGLSRPVMGLLYLFLTTYSHSLEKLRDPNHSGRK